ncbi:DUF4252 domain-containing protein [Flavobacterium sp. SM2513]|uniref:DUF4252 domain-containing protein n=1 Tax=Flavobacterium sp. SM2513 TaxID=3424766 RepID=UPI003D7F8F6D
MKTKIFLLSFACLLLVNCNSKPSLQKYFVSHSEDSNFISVDISPSILNIDKKLLSDEEQRALRSFDKMNILAFELHERNNSVYETEKETVQKILDAENYNLLMKYGSGKQGVAVSYLGTDEKVDEIVVFAKSAETGFAVVRILGNEMTPTDMMHLIVILQKSKIDLEQLKPLQEMMPKKQ